MRPQFTSLSPILPVLFQHFPVRAFTEHLLYTKHLARSWKDKLDKFPTFRDSINEWAERPVSKNLKQRSHLQTWREVTVAKQ